MNEITKLEKSLHSQNADERWRAIYRLGQIGSAGGNKAQIPEIINKLSSLIRDDNDSGCRNLSVWAINEIMSVNLEEWDYLRTRGFDPIEREMVEIDGVVESSDMVLCEKYGKRVRVRLEPGSDHLADVHYDDASN